MSAVCSERAQIDRHFSGRIDPASECALRAHLPDCSRCRRYYGRYLLLSRIDPAMPPADERLGSPLRLRPQRRRSHAVGVVAAVAIAAAALFVIRVSASRDFVPRGTAVGAPPPELRVFRLRKGTQPQLVGASIHASDELAFAYRSPGRARHLLVYGADEHGHLYWYYPAWEDVADDPPAIAIEASAELRELPDAVGNDLDGHRLFLHALFVSTSVRASAIEHLARAGDPAAPLALPNAVQSIQVIEVER